MRHLAWITCLALSACGARFADANKVEPGQEFVLNAGAAAAVGGLTVRFDQVLEDSRCPMNARCVWEGNARVAFTISRDGKASSLTLNTSERFKTHEDAGDVVLRLVRLEPTPMAGEKVKEYTVVLITEAKP
jgi:hypothetical protein